MRWRFDLAYDGTDFHGWADQPGLRTVQGVLESWLNKLLRTDACALTVAGRTDAGVHARGQVAHLDADVDDGIWLERKLQQVLPTDIALRSIREAKPGFDARFSAIWRRYCYRVWDATSTPDPLLSGHIARVTSALDEARINAAAQGLLGLRDFAPFCKHRVGATTIRTLLDVHAQRRPDSTIEITVLADAFCHSMVRSLVGALVAVGSGAKTTAWLEHVAAQPTRAGDVLVMPARGLTLEEVAYPSDDALAERARSSRSMRTLGES